MHFTRLVALGGLALLGLNACSGDLTDPDPIRPSFSVVNTLTGQPLAHGGWVPNSTNALNEAKQVPGRVGQIAPYVIFKGAGVGEVTLEFHNMGPGLAFFEVRIDGVATGATVHPVVTGSTIHTGGQSVTKETSPIERTFSAATTVDIRLALGGERDWDFDWTRFYVPSGHLLTLHDELDNPLAGQAGDFRYRCGGSWAPWAAFTSDGNGQFGVDPSCAAFPGKNWDSKVTVRLNQVSKEQVVTSNPVYTAARINVNLTSCTGPITASPGGRVDQGGGHWFYHGMTGPSGTVTFYTFPGSVKIRMGYNQLNVTMNSVPVSAGVNEVNFPTTKVTMVHPAGIRSNTGGSWWNFAQPSMDLQPGTYNFQFRNGTSWGPLTPFVISGCGGTLLRVVDELGNGVAGAEATPATGGSWQPQVPGATNAGGYLFGSLPTGTTKVKMAVNGTSQEKTSAQMAADGYTWTTELLRISLNDHLGSPITTGADLQIGLGGWPSLGSLGTHRDIPLFGNQNFRVTYNHTTEQKSAVVAAGPGIQTLTFQTGQVVGSCSNYAGGGWPTFVSGMQLMPGTRDFRYPQAAFTVIAGQVNNVPCTP